MRRPSWSFVFVIFKTILVSFAIQRQSSSMACGDHHGHPLSLFSRLLKSSFFIQRQSSPMACRDNYGLHLHFKDDNAFSHCMPSKVIMTIIFILKTTMSLVIACFQKATMTFICILKMTMSLVIACLQRRQ